MEAAPGGALHERLLTMFAPTFSHMYATCKGQACIVIGYEALAAAGLRVLVALIDGGDLVLADLKDVKIDVDKIVRLDR